MNALDISNPLLRKEIKNLFLYGICGSLGVLTDLSIYTALIYLGAHYKFAFIIGYAAGTLVSFIINRRVTFKALDNTKRRMVMFFTVAAIGSVVSMAVIWVMVDILHILPVIAKIISLFFVFATQYVLNRLITFRKKLS
jgi:putative flippase GtrA